jgi:hypothetical protein
MPDNDKFKSLEELAHEIKKTSNSNYIEMNLEGIEYINKLLLLEKINGLNRSMFKK